MPVTSMTKVKNNEKETCHFHWSSKLEICQWEVMFKILNDLNSQATIDYNSQVFTY